MILRPAAGGDIPATRRYPACQRAVVGEHAGGATAAQRGPQRQGDCAWMASPQFQCAAARHRIPATLQAQARVDQGFGGNFSHDDVQNRHALDFAADIGTPVLAARAGTVMQVEDGFRASGLTAGDYAAAPNFIRILHDDGSMALYAHLAADGVQVRVGQQVTTGQRIGLSGNTGFSTGPHLHFVVQVNRGMQLVSIPFRMRGVASAH